MCDRSNKYAFEQLLMMLIDYGYHETIKKDYEEEYKKLSEKINSKTKVLTKKG